jgi:hypothetical protein
MIMNAKTKFAFEYATGDEPRSPVEQRRARLIDRLKEQSLLATDATKNMRVTTRNKKGSGPVEIKRIIRPQWRAAAGGKLIFWVKGGPAGKLELAPGKFAVVIPDTKSIPQLVDAMIERVSSGEFDQQLAAKRETKKPASAPAGKLRVVGRDGSGKKKAS